MYLATLTSNTVGNFKHQCHLMIGARLVANMPIIYRYIGTSWGQPGMDKLTGDIFPWLERRIKTKLLPYHRDMTSCQVLGPISWESTDDDSSQFVLCFSILTTRIEYLYDILVHYYYLHTYLGSYDFYTLGLYDRWREGEIINVDRVVDLG